MSRPFPGRLVFSSLAFYSIALGLLVCFGVEPVEAQTQPTVNLRKPYSYDSGSSGNSSAPQKTTPSTKVAAPVATPTTPAETAVKPQKENKEKVRTGIIAGSGKYTKVSAIDVDTSGNAPGDEANVIGAGLSEIGNGRCQVSVRNMSEENSYSVRFTVRKPSGSGRKTVPYKTYSARIKPSGDYKRDFRCDGQAGYEVELRSAKKLGS